jgi:hypothetical protein
MRSELAGMVFRRTEYNRGELKDVCNRLARRLTSWASFLFIGRLPLGLGCDRCFLAGDPIRGTVGTDNARVFFSGCTMHTVLYI